MAEDGNRGETGALSLRSARVGAAVDFRVRSANLGSRVLLRRRGGFAALASLIVLALVGSVAASEPPVDVQPSGSKYLGQEPPGESPEIFAPGWVSTADGHEFGSVFSADGLELFYGVDLGGRAEIRHIPGGGQEVSGPQSESQILLSHPTYSYNDPFLSPDETRLYFISDRALDGKGEKKDIDIWFVERLGEDWSGPINVNTQHQGAAINSEKNEYYISFTSDGTLYFASNIAAPEDREGNFDIYSSKLVGGKYQVPERLGEGVNSRGYEADAFVAPDESYLIFSAGRRGGLGRGDLYISFRKPDGSWTVAKNLGEPINTPGHELCPFVTRDGKYLFYTSRQDIYWVDAKILERYR